MYRYATGGGCRHQRLVGHFGEKLPACRTSCDECCDEVGFGWSDAARTQPRWERAESERSAECETAAHGGMGRSTKQDGLTATVCEQNEQTALFNRLRVLRKELATLQHVPAYVIFSDATLLEMAAQRPRNEEELLAISGVGPKKLAAYGQPFLRVLAE
ncbi:MAG: HRDC domain-containing protein [Polyangiaceae bacterium]|nr:HRDC domain-containing protein [Polyangiaceae bacterium]